MNSPQAVAGAAQPAAAPRRAGPGAPAAAAAAVPPAAPVVPGGAEADAWAQLGAAQTAEQLCRAWLAVLCRRVAHVRAAVLLLREDGGSYAPAALLPAGLDATPLAGCAQQVLDGGSGVRLPQPDGSLQLGYPLQSQGVLHGVVVLDLARQDEAALPRAMRDVHWGAGWLVDLFGRRQLALQAARQAHGELALELAALVAGDADTEHALLTLVNRVAQHLGCHQVLLGVERGHSVRVRAMSHAAWFDRRANLLNLAAQAMNEAFDQRQRTLVPAAGASPGVLLDAALREYAAHSGCAAVCALPLEHGGALAGVLLLQRDEPFGKDELALLDLLGVTLGPVVGLRLSAQQSLPRHALASLRWLGARLGDGSHPGVKLGVALTALALAVLALVEVDYRVAARASVEGAVQRVAAAPFDGFLREAPVRAGDTVRRGQLLALMDDRDLRLEHDRWQAELDMALKRQREAQAQGERVEMRLAAAKAAQAQAQLALADEKLARTRIEAPFDAVVVSGDLSQALGSPLETGKVLFELAPLDAWRVILQVDERDIADVAENSAGTLVLNSLPQRSWALGVRKITPVSVPRDGHNHFRVEAQLQGGSAEVRPGMEGVAKIEAGRRSLLWQATHRFTDWLQLTLWQWLP